ncbi:clock-controlled pheromone ccg-4 [Colletotrichum orchidophilum]|uniref:Clock-controlled pheromone ccg-4 n=1 Tax=Colletotrichum orchidophilum TaxID=1209926 RepID=A0A1G4BQJ6_9PEZI|nr:clock-controlled pheromone ccg-4 [Colletotrichum orchidophilum]OHF03557.1 clock-controlled pheromone ccg-4 [Colletotrichum orchidophilum]
MKYFAAMVILTIAADAIAVALPGAITYNWPGKGIGWCQNVGQACWKAKEKRAAELKREAVVLGQGWCQSVGQSCWKDKTKTKREAEADPYDWPGRGTGWCQNVGEPCWRVKRAADTFAVALAKDDLVIERDSAEALVSHAQGGAAFMAKRALNELADVVAASQDDPFFYYGGLDLRNHFADDTSELARREAEAKEGWVENVGHPDEKRWCSLPGAPCAIARRAAEALVDAIEGVGEVANRGNETAQAGVPPDGGRCQSIGQPCWKARVKREPFCTSYDQGCWTRSADSAAWKASRDLKAMKSAARDLLEAVA